MASPSLAAAGGRMKSIKALLIEGRTGEQTNKVLTVEPRLCGLKSADYYTDLLQLSRLRLYYNVLI